MKNKYMLVCLFMFVSCGNGKEASKNSVFNKIEHLRSLLMNVKSKEKEFELLNKIWELSYQNPNISLYIEAKDESGSEVIQRLSKAKGKVKIYITLGLCEKSPQNSKKKLKKCKIEIEFIPIDIKNVYILLRE